MNTASRLMLGVGSLAVAMLAANAVYAANCAAYTYPNFTNGTTADGSQVTQNFDDIRNCANNNLAPLANPSFTGNVGIGTASPTWPLRVYRAQNAQTWALVENTNTGNQVQAGLQILTSAGSFFVGLDGSGYTFTTPRAFVWSNANVPLVFATNGSEYMRILTNGRVGIGTNAPTLTLHVNGSVGGIGAYQNLSDGRLKKDVRPVTGALSLVQRLRPVRFQWLSPDERKIGKSLALPLNEQEIGFVAQEVETVVPEAVAAPKKGSNDPYGLREGELVPILVAAIKEQQAEIDELKAAVASLKARK